MAQQGADNRERAIRPEASAAADVFAVIREELAAFEQEFARQIASDVPLIAEIGRYVKDGGGKRIRPALLLLSAKLWGRPVTPSVIRLAVVVEFIHTATLVHDDIIDGAEVRRGRPSVNARWGNQITVLMGDWLYMRAFEMALEERSFEILDLLTRITRKMTEGELIQLGHIGDLFITRERYFEILRRKTAYLFSACAEIGGILGGASSVEQHALREYGMHLGTAFQLIDDVLDFVADEESLGKPAGNDLREGKVTLPVILLIERGEPKHVEMVRAVLADGGYRRVTRQELVAVLEAEGALERAREEARAYARRASACLRGLAPSPYREALDRIAEFTVERTR
jgi:octaprenyl-diphosphate synthase